MSCPPDHDLEAGVCYPRCRDGYTGMGPVCWQNCPPDFDDIGLACMKPNYTRGPGEPPPSPPQPTMATPLTTETADLETISTPPGIPIWFWIVIGILILIVIALIVALILKRCPTPTYQAVGQTPSYQQARQI